MDNFIQFKKQRDLGAILTDTFKFFRIQGKELFTMILKVTGIPLALLIISSSFYVNSTIGNLDFMMYADDLSIFTPTVIISLFVMLISVFFFFVLLYGLVLCYIKNYTENQGVISRQKVYDNLKNKFADLCGVGFLTSIIFFGGFMLCVIPGIYTGVVLFTVYAIMIFNNTDATKSISNSFNLIKGEWWITFATILVLYVLYYIILMIFQIPQYFYFFYKMLTVSQSVSVDSAEMFDGVYIVLNAFTLIAQYLLQTILVVASAFVYFNLNEKKNFTGTLEAIDEIGYLK